MKRRIPKILSVGLALVLALSLCLVTAVPAVAADPDYAAVTLAEGDPGTADWSIDEAHSGNYSVKLYAESSGHGKVVMPLDMAFSGIDDFSVWVEGGGEAQSLPLLAIELDVSTLPIIDMSVAPYYAGLTIAEPSAVDFSSFDRVLVNTQPGQDEGWSPTLKTDAGAGWELYGTHGTPDIDVGTGAYWGIQVFDAEGNWGIFYYFTWDEIHALLDTDATVIDVKAEMHGPYPTAPSTVYVDDITIKGVTYDLEPMVLDAEYYSTGDPVNVTVCNGNASVQVQVGLASTLAEHSTNILASEISGNPGVFEGSFTLVDTWTGVNQLLVIDGDTVTATYTGDWGAGSQKVEVSAGVDDTDPVVEITAPSDEDFVAGAAVLITWTTTEGTCVLLIDDDVVEVASGETWNTLAKTEDVPDWPDGSYTIEVVATDAAGNVGSDSIDVTVDNTLPVVGDQEATPPVVEPDVEKTIVFTADVTDTNIDTVTIDLSAAAIGGSATEPMLDDGLLSDVEEGDGIYTAEITVTIATEATYTLAVTATDLAGLSVTTEGEDLLKLVVSSDTVPPVITDAAITYPFVGVNSAQPGEDVIISVNVIDVVGMGTVTAACTAFETSPVSLTNGVGDIYTGTATVDSDAGWGDYPVTITAKDAKENEAIDETLILAVRYGATGVPIELVKGWNLISLPLIPDSSDITVVISATTLLSEDVSSVGTVLGYDPATGDFPRYIPGTGGALTEMEDGQGYWVFMEEDDTLTITGREMPVPPDVPPTYDVVVGWNLIGFKSMGNMIDYDADEDTGYLLNIAGTYPVLWSYDAVAGAYENVKGAAVAEDGMLVGHGFWIWITEVGTIVPPQ